MVQSTVDTATLISHRSLSSRFLSTFIVCKWKTRTNKPFLPLEPTPAEEAAARAKEAEEQAALPYKWTQQIGDLDVTVEVPGTLKGKDMVVDIKKTRLVVGIKGQPPIISVSLPIPFDYPHDHPLNNRPPSKSTKQKVSQTSNTLPHNRAISPMQSTSTNQLGRSPPRHPAQKSSNYISTK